jgi:hypothetical protein
MTELRQRIEPIRSAAIRDSARGAECTLNFPCCNHDPETTVWCHWEDDSFGMGRKAHDTSGFPGCSACHHFLDVLWAGRMEIALVRWYVIRAMQRAFVHLIETKVVSVKLDETKPFAARKKPGKKGRSRAIPQRADPWPESRPLTSRNSFKQKAAK